MNNRFKLFHLPLCPYCIRVRRAADKLGIELDLVDIGADRAARDHLLENRGRATVPVLYDAVTAQLIPESRDIIQYLRGVAKERERSAG